MGMESSPRYSSVQLWRILLGGKLGPIEVDLRVFIKWSIEIPEALAVVRAVFIVLVWHSMKPLDVGYWGEEVI